MVFQHYELFQNKTALQNITEGLIVARKVPKEEAIAQATQALIQVGLEDRADSYPHQLSGGQQQRIGIARALALNPEVLLFDEPTSALDPEMVGDVLLLIKEVANSGRTLILVTHEMEFAYQLARRVMFLDGGEFVEAGTPNELFGNPKQERTKQFLSRFKASKNPEYFI
jgi:L-cystine transport system ATP-binding protein